MTIIITLIKSGYRFSQVWPHQEPYLAHFPQTRMVKAARLMLNICPAIAIITLYVQISLLGTQWLNMTLAMAIFIGLMPIQALLMLGKTADQPLPHSLRNWYKEIEQKLQEGHAQLIESQNVKKSNARSLKYIDLALLLKTLFSTNKPN